MGAIMAAVGDMVFTFMWVFCAATFGLMTTTIVNVVGIQTFVWAPVVISMLILFVFLFVFITVGDALGGAGFNPTGNVAFYAAGIGRDTLFSMALRFPAQALGAVGGVLAITEVIPAEYKHMIGGPTLKVDLHTGAMAEGVLTFLVTFLVLLILLKGPASIMLKIWLLAISIVLLVVAGGGYTGPAMNPAIAFGWAYVYKSHNTWEHFYVYSISPFVGAILAAWVFRAIYPPQPQVVKVKKQKKT